MHAQLQILGLNFFQHGVGSGSSGLASLKQAMIYRTDYGFLLLSESVKNLILLLAAGAAHAKCRAALQNRRPTKGHPKGVA
jgi:hypothetical protein